MDLICIDGQVFGEEQLLMHAIHIFFIDRPVHLHARACRAVP